MAVTAQVIVHPAGAITQSPAPPHEVPPSPRNLCSSPSQKRSPPQEVPSSPRNLRITPSEERAPRESTWPHGWAHSGNVTAFSIDLSMVNAETMRALTDATLKHLGGKLLSVTWKYVASLQTSLRGKVTVAPAATPSRAYAFAAMGCRIYFKGVQKNQQNFAQVQVWMREVAAFGGAGVPAATPN